MTKDAKPYPTAVTVKISKDPKGGYSFAFCNADGLCDKEGNLDFRKTPAKHRPVKLSFAIDADSVKGVKFQPRGDDAMWIALKSATGPRGCPKGPYKGDQFVGFAVQERGRRMHVNNKNDDKESYRYSLRFDINGELVECDPDADNSGPPATP